MGKNTIKEIMVPVAGNSNYNNLLVRLYYSLGGMNYFTYKTERRGYYLSVTPVNVEDRGGYEMIAYSPLDGIKTLVKEVSRRSAKADKDALTAMDNAKRDGIYGMMILRVCENTGIDRDAVSA